jgi:hypothetical protein
MSRSACQSPVTVSRTKTMAHGAVAGDGRTTYFPGAAASLSGGPN